MSWKRLARKISAHKADNATWRSNQRSLLEIVQFCEKSGIIDCYAENTSISNLCVITREARLALQKKDASRLETLFFHAAKLTNAELRLWIGSAQREAITALDHDGCITITLNREQLGRIQRATRIKFAFA